MMWASRLVLASRLPTIMCLAALTVASSLSPAHSTDVGNTPGSASNDSNINQNEVSLRIPRPSTTFQFHESFTVKRETAISGNFERWRRDYCCPPVCAMVLCHGACIDTVDHCPSFAEVNLVLHRVNACSMGDGGSGGGTKPSSQGCCE